MTAVIVRPVSGRIRICGLRAPQGDEAPNREMFKTAAGARIRPDWVRTERDDYGWRGHWTISRDHLTAVAEAIAIRDGSVEIRMHYSDSERCDTRCQRATGDDCTCSCKGKHHGAAAHASWKEVGSTTLVKTSGTTEVVRTLSGKRALKDRARRA